MSESLGTYCSNTRLDPDPFKYHSETRCGWFVLGAVWIASSVYLGIHLREVWIPNDAGMLAEMASRILRHQVPYRDFVEVYTGGLAYLDALAFRLFGANFFSLRIPLFVCFLGWVPSVYFIARRFSGPLGAALVTLLGVVWSVPNYPEAMPSWYNLFLATWGTLALLRYTETDRDRWLLIAGFCGGLSFLVKLSGLYFIAAALLFLMFREQSMNGFASVDSKRNNLIYRIFVTTCLLLFLGVLAFVVLSQPTARQLVYFILPSTFLVTLLALQAWRGPWHTGPARFKTLLGMALPFLAGSIVPVVPFLLWLSNKGALGPWFQGVFVLSGRHVEWATFPLPSLLLQLALVPLLLVLLPSGPKQAPTRAQNLGALAVLTALLVGCRLSVALYASVGLAPMLLAPAVALGALLWLQQEVLSMRRQQTFLLVSVATVCSLIEFPFGLSIYFCYVAPLVFLAVAALSSSARRIKRPALGALALFYLAFAFWFHAPGYYMVMGTRQSMPHTLDLPRAGGLRVAARQASVYERLIPLVRAHARSTYIYCTPDCPQVYFLSGKLNPTGTIYDFLDSDFFNPLGRADRILSDIHQHRVRVVVLAPADQANSGAMAPDLRAALDKRFPKSQTVGRFQVRWR